MNTEVTPTKTLQERVGDRIRDQIGDLMTDEDLKLLVDRALTDAFFKDRRESRQYGPDIIHPPAIVELVKGLLQARVDAACVSWLSEHKDELGEHIDDAVGRGFMKMFQVWLDAKVQGDLFIFTNSLKQRLGLN